MAKETMKAVLKERQADKCTATGAALPKAPKHYDTHRKQPKRKGGVYDPALKNVVALLPPAHMAEHGTLRTRPEIFEELKVIMDDRRQAIKVKLKINNQLLAYQRMTDTPSAATVDFYNNVLATIEPKVKELDKAAARSVKALSEVDPLVKAALGVPCVGPITVATCVVYLDLEKARHASSVWKYAGLHAASHDRYQKGETSGGNKTLRTALYMMAESQMKGSGPYRVVYDQVKARLSASDRITKSRNTQGALIECAWKDTKPCHRHGAALRAVMKHFLADYWYVGRTLAGLETTPIYAEEKLSGDHKTIMPAERGWVF